MMKLILPETAEFSIKRRKDGTCRFRYSETFHDRDLIRATALGLGPKLLGMKCSARGNRITLAGNRVPWKTAAAMMASEFFGWTDLASQPLAKVAAKICKLIPARANVRDLMGTVSAIVHADQTGRSINGVRLRAGANGESLGRVTLKK